VRNGSGINVAAAVDLAKAGRRTVSSKPDGAFRVRTDPINAALFIDKAGTYGLE